jgi:peroxiredoxin
MAQASSFVPSRAPCRAEVANMRENYEKYHDKGFEIIGISLDRDRAPLQAYLARERIPWRILYNGTPESPTATYYGVVTVPTAILVGEDGRVVSTSALGPELGEQLQSLLEPAHR